MKTSDIPSFHDGLLIGVAVAEKSATLSFRRASGGLYDIVLEGLEALQMDNFREGNIVFSLEIIAGPDRTGSELDDHMKRLFPSPHPAAETKYLDTYAAFLEGRVARIVDQTAKLIVVSSSYGAELVAYCATVRLDRPNRPHRPNS